MFARLKPGVSVEQAQTDVNALAGPLGEELDMNRGWGLKVDSLRDAYAGNLRQPLLIFQGAVVILSLIACANVAGLMLAQAALRQKELAVRAALGSTRLRVIRQLLTESVLLSLIGGVAGIALGWAGLRIVTRIVPTVAPPSGAVTLDFTVIGVALGMSFVTGLVFGGLPALQISRPDVMDVLRESSRSTTASGARQQLRGAFVVIQVALSLVLLIGAGLLTHSLMRLNMVQSGFDPYDLTTFQVPFSRTLYRAGQTPNTPTGGLQVEIAYREADSKQPPLRSSARDRRSCRRRAAGPLSGKPADADEHLWRHFRASLIRGTVRNHGEHGQPAQERNRDSRCIGGDVENGARFDWPAGTRPRGVGHDPGPGRIARADAGDFALPLGRNAGGSVDLFPGAHGDGRRCAAGVPSSGAASAAH